MPQQDLLDSTRSLAAAHFLAIGAILGLNPAVGVAGALVNRITLAGASTRASSLSGRGRWRTSCWVSATTTTIITQHFLTAQEQFRIIPLQKTTAVRNILAENSCTAGYHCHEQDHSDRVHHLLGLLHDWSSLRSDVEMNCSDAS